MAREINLVPDVKNEMLKAMKIRNYTFFACIVVAIASIVVALIFWSIAAGQQAVADSKKKTLDTLSSKVNSYSDLSDFLTIKDQLGTLSSLSSNRRVLSRTFNILAALIPAGPDSITISQLDINLEESSPKIEFEGQANANTEPYIDYNVLDSFKKSMQYMRYDYGEYVDKEGNTIPAYCMIENAADGSTFRDEKKGYYALWLINGEGCDPSEETDAPLLGEEDEDLEINKLDLTTDIALDTKNKSGYTTEEYEGQQVVRIWRTPQFDEWYKEDDRVVEGQPSMTLDGTISGVPHFNSSCITYVGTEQENGKKPTWSSMNESCLLVPDGTDGISITNSSNGRENDEFSTLVLRFTAEITFDPEVFAFKNHHMLALGPTNRVNVTDSYVQIQSIFAERASDCDENDAACTTINTNGGGEN